MPSVIPHSAFCILHSDERRPFRPVPIAEAALRGRRERADGVDLVAEELQTLRRLGVGRKHVEDAAAATELAGQFDRVGTLVAVIDEPGGQLLQVGRLAAPERAAARGELGPAGDRLQERLNGGQQQARGVVGVELFEETETLAGDLIDDLAGRRLIVPGGKDRGADAGEREEIAGPAVEVARVGDDDEERLRGVRRQGGDRQTGG